MAVLHKPNTPALRDVFKTASISEMKLFTIVCGFQSLTIETKNPILFKDLKPLTIFAKNKKLFEKIRKTLPSMFYSFSSALRFQRRIWHYRGI